MTPAEVRCILEALGEAVCRDNRAHARALVRSIPRGFAPMDPSWASIWRNQVILLHYKAEEWLAGDDQSGDRILDELELVTLTLDNIEHEAKQRVAIAVDVHRSWSLDELATDLRANGIIIDDEGGR